jgi:hypothetical protein
MCRYIVGKIIWEEMQKHTDIQNWNGWENWKNIETKMLQKNKKMLWNSERFFTNSKLYYSWKP